MILRRIDKMEYEMNHVKMDVIPRPKYECQECGEKYKNKLIEILK